MNWRTIVDEVDGVLASKGTSNAPFYHYTSVKSFLGILKGREFWMSNIHFMNDEQEFYDGQNLCIEMIEEYLKTDFAHKEYLVELQGMFHQETSGALYRLRSRDIYGISFCRDRNLLSQWQSYGENGVAIGFEGAASNPFEEICFLPSKRNSSPEEIPFHVTDVVYDEEIKRQLLHRIIDYGSSYLNRYGKDAMRQVLNSVSGALFYYFTYMKNNAFSQENECRFIYSYSDTQRKKWPDLIDFREQNGIVLPYIQLKMLARDGKEDFKLPIKEIVIAPGEKKEYIASSVKYFLEHNRLGYLADRVKISDIPYRG